LINFSAWLRKWRIRNYVDGGTFGDIFLSFSLFFPERFSFFSPASVAA